MAVARYVGEVGDGRRTRPRAPAQFEDLRSARAGSAPDAAARPFATAGRGARGSPAGVRGAGSGAELRQRTSHAPASGSTIHSRLPATRARTPPPAPGRARAASSTPSPTQTPPARPSTSSTSSRVRHRRRARQPRSDDRPGRVRVAHHPLQLPPREQPVAQRPAERVPRAEPVDHLHRHRRDLRDRPVAVDRQHALRAPLDHRQLHPGREQRPRRRVRLRLAGGDRALLGVADGHRRVRQRPLVVRRRVSPPPQHRPPVQVEDRRSRPSPGPPAPPGSRARLGSSLRPVPVIQNTRAARTASRSSSSAAISRSGAFGSR